MYLPEYLTRLRLYLSHTHTHTHTHGHTHTDYLSGSRALEPECEQTAEGSMTEQNKRGGRGVEWERTERERERETERMRERTE